MRENINSNISSLNRDSIDDDAVRNQHENLNTTDNARNNQHANDERDADGSPTNTTGEKILPDGVQGLGGEKVSEEKCNSNKESHERVCVGPKRRKSSLSKKAKSFFRKKSRLAIADSDYTLLLPGPRARVRSKARSNKLCGHLKVSAILEENGEKISNYICICL